MTPSPNDMLISSPNPHRNRIYTVAITQEITLNGQFILFTLRYIPDKLILDHQGLANYLSQIIPGGFENAETLAHDILEDIVDHLIPKWIEVNLKQTANKFGQQILITIEDRQPTWDNDAFLTRLPAII